MSIGSNIKRLRENTKNGKKLTQEQLAEQLGVTFQAVSSWERDEYLPETANVLKLMKALDTSADAILDDRKWDFETKETIYKWEHMKTYVKTIARVHDLSNTLKAIDFAVRAHDGQSRKNTTLPYIIHPLHLACHALALNIIDDEIIAACMLHDVVEDCRDKGIELEDLPVDDNTKELVRLLTRVKGSGENRAEELEAYYGAMLRNPKAALIKCLDRCNNLTTMSWGLSRDKIYRTINETEQYYPALLDVLKGTSEYSNAAWLLKYQIESMLDIYKRLM